MALSELLSSQSRPKIRVLDTDDGKCFFGTFRLQASITWPVPELRDEASWSLKLVTLNQPPNLADRKPETLGDGLLFELLVDQSLNALKPV